MKKKVFSVKGVGELYSETKQTITIGVTPTAKAGLEDLAQQLGISRSELVERIGRGIIKLQLDTQSRKQLEA